MTENVKDALYNASNERQRMLNNLAKNGLRVDDQWGSLAWRIASDSHELSYKQEELFAELCNLIKRIRNSRN